jgi:hypothetical protein
MPDTKDSSKLDLGPGQMALLVGGSFVLALLWPLGGLLAGAAWVARGVITLRQAEDDRARSLAMASLAGGIALVVFIAARLAIQMISFQSGS